MKTSKKAVACIIGTLALIVLILDTQSAVTGIRDGIRLCVESIIPALLPFCIVSKFLMRLLLGHRIRFLNKVGKICGIPKGAESIFLIGFLGGYPTGAQCICDAVHSKALSKKDAERMLGYCNNVGPSFIFGILSGVFSSTKAVWSLMLIQVLSAIVVGAILPYKERSYCYLPVRQQPQISDILVESVKTMRIVCTWVVVFKMILQYIKKWFCYILEPRVTVILAGILELSNGCISLYEIQSEGLCYILSAGLLSFGGLCVAMQTKTVAQGLSYQLYIPGKILQCIISILLAITVQPLVIPAEKTVQITLWAPIICIVFSIVILYILHARKKVVAIV